MSSFWLGPIHFYIPDYLLFIAYLITLPRIEVNYFIISEQNKSRARAELEQGKSRVRSE
jgi:hypothetical protein